MRNYIILAIIFSAFNSCSDSLELEKSDLKKYPWLAPFLTTDIVNFQGNQNIDLGIMHFSYAIPLNIYGIPLKMDSVALKENWTIVNSSNTSKKYSKELNAFHTDKERTFIEINIDTIENRILFYIK